MLTQEQKEMFLEKLKEIFQQQEQLRRERLEMQQQMIEMLTLMADKNNISNFETNNAAEEEKADKEEDAEINFHFIKCVPEVEVSPSQSSSGAAISTNEENLEEEENTDVVEFIIYDVDFFNITDEVKQSCDSEDDSTNEASTADAAEGVFGEEIPFIKCDEALAIDLTWVTGAVPDKEKAKEEEHETIVLDKAKDGPQTRAVHHTSSIFLRNLTTSITNTEIEVVCQKFNGYSCVAIDKEADGGDDIQDKEADGGDDNQDAEEKSNLDKDRDGPLKLEGEHENDDTGIVLEAVEKKISEEETAAIDDEGIDGAAEDSDDSEAKADNVFGEDDGPFIQTGTDEYPDADLGRIYISTTYLYADLKINKSGQQKIAKLWSWVPGYFCHKNRKRKIQLFK